MTKRTRIVNDPADLVPILQSFASEPHRKVFTALAGDWKSEDELKKSVGDNVQKSLQMLRRGGLLESKWRMPEPGKTPDKEYRSSYSAVLANFQCSLDDLGDVVKVMFMTDKELEKIANAAIKEIKAGKKSLNNLCKSLGVSPTFLKGVAHITSRFVVKGQRVDLVEDKVKPK